MNASAADGAPNTPLAQSSFAERQILRVTATASAALSGWLLAPDGLRSVPVVASVIKQRSSPMPLPNAIDLGTFESPTAKRLRKINEKIAAAQAKRNRRSMIAVAATTIPALFLAYVRTTGMVLPAWERVTKEYQEQITWVR
ncbi:MAG TPA: hypothetical protein VGO22_03145 [Pseudorhizobium sp.]|nr:hypothetical protein [Pseudorhizobium sp.]